MFLKFKSYGRLKGRTCADGQKKCKKEVSGDTTSPTVSKKSVLITSTIDAHEGWDVRICDIPDAFLSADMDKDMKMALRGRLA